MNNLKIIRTVKQMSQYILQINTGIPQSRTSLMENNLYFPKDKEKEKLAAVLGVSIDELFPDNTKAKLN